VRAWWKGDASYNLGLVVPEGFVVLDLDGKKALQYLAAEDKVVPATLEASTGNGHHYWYRLPEGVTGKRAINVFGSKDSQNKIDLILNGYVMAPPSVHPNGLSYSWKTEFNPSYIADAPQWIVDFLATQSLYEKDKVEPDQVLAGIAEGSRDNDLWRYACYLRGQRNLSKKEALTLIEAAARACNPPFDLEIARGKVERAWNYAKKEDIKFRPKIYKARELANSDLPPPKFFAYHVNERGRKEGLVVPGVTIVSSEPKAGKSALVQYIVGQIAAGKPFWNDHYVVTQTGVLYIDLEQTPEDGTDRLKELFSPEEIPLALDVAYEWPRMDNGGMDALRETLQLNPHIGIVVIDVLTKFWPSEMKGDGNAYNKEYRVMDELVQFSKDYGVGLILVHHDNKTAGSSMIKNASGTYAIVGSAHAVWNLKRKKGEVVGILEVTGKNIPDKKLTLQYYNKSFRWGLQEIE